MLTAGIVVSLGTFTLPPEDAYVPSPREAQALPLPLPPKPLPCAIPQAYAYWIYYYAAWTGVPYWMLARQISKEVTGDVLSARWDPTIVNYLGAAGLGQLMPANLDMTTDRGRQFAAGTNDGKPIDPKDPETAIRVCARHLADMARWTGSWRLGLMAYNGGAGHWLDPHRYGDWQPESIDYARAILGGAA